MVPSYHLSIETPTPLVLGVGVMFAPVTCVVTFMLLGRRLSGNVLLEEYLQCVRRLLALQALFLLRLRLPHALKLLREFRFLGLLLLLLPLCRYPFYMSAFFGSHAPLVFPTSLPSFRRAGLGVGGLGMPLCCFPRVFISSRSTKVELEGWRSLWSRVCARELASVSSVHSWTRESGVALWRQTPATCFVPVGCPSSTLHAWRGVGEGESSGAFTVLGCLSRLISAHSARWWGG